MTATNPRPLLAVDHISKRFGITQALDDVSVTFAAGEVHALIGENGAGKSTLAKIVAGLLAPDSGSIVLGGERLRLGSLQEAFAAGVRMVHQELAQCPNLSVAENLCLHDLPRHRFAWVDRRAMTERAVELLRGLDPDIDVAAPLGSLPPGRRQIVQIASALDERAAPGSAPAGPALGKRTGARVIVFDEPTSSLSVAETDRLLEIVRQLAREGITIVYVSHRMGEIFACCQRVTVLRDGKIVATSRIEEVDHPLLVQQMIGRRLEMAPRRASPASGGQLASPAERAAPISPPSEPRSPAGARLEIRSLRVPGLLHDVSLTLSPGEVLGIGGLVGSGRSELLTAIFGLDPRSSGEILLDGKRALIRSPRDAIRCGIGYVPEDRRLQGLFFDLSVHENIALPEMPRVARWGWRDYRSEDALVTARLTTFQVKTASPASLPGELSGGNQQKLLIARWMGRDTRVLLLDEPTRGIDVGTKSEIYRLIQEAAARGTSVLLVSSEMPELLMLSDRLVVLCEGRLTGELRGDAMTQAAVLQLATRHKQEHRSKPFFA
ncbi:MAG: sugar ABC transporter ATP-binding protein [Planctomycetota bacterium]